MIKSCRRYWNARNRRSIVQLKNIRFDNPMFSLSTTFDRHDFTRLLVERFGMPAATVEPFFDAARNMNFYDDQAMTTGQLFERFFPGREDVVRLLMEPITYANGSTLEDPALTYGIVFSNFMSKGVYTFQGGTDRLMRTDGRELRQSGVDVRIRCDVEKIHVAGRRVRGVTVDGRHDRGPGGRLQRQPARARSSTWSGEDAWDRRFRRAGPGGAAEQFQHAGLHGPAAGRDDRRGGLRRSAVQLHRPALPHRAAAEPRRSPAAPIRSIIRKTRPGRDRSLIVSSTNANYRDWAGLSPEDYAAGKRRPDREHARRPGQVRARHPRASSTGSRLPRRSPSSATRDTSDGASFGTKFEGLAVSRAMPRADRRPLSCRQRGHYHVRLARRGELRRDRGQRGGRVSDEGVRRVGTRACEMRAGRRSESTPVVDFSPVNRNMTRATDPRRHPAPRAVPAGRRDRRAGPTRGSSARRPFPARRISLPAIIPAIRWCRACCCARRPCSAGRSSSPRHLARRDGKVPVATRMNDVRFKRIVRPGETIRMEVELVERLADAFFLKAKVTVDGKLAVRLEFACTAATIGRAGDA